MVAVSDAEAVPELNVTVQVCVPGAVRAAVLTDAVKDAGIVPLVLLNWSQLQVAPGVAEKLAEVVPLTVNV